MPSIDYSMGYSARFEIRPVDRTTWSSGDTIDGLLSATVECDCTDAYPLLQSGSADVTLPAGGEWEEGYYRIEMVASQGSAKERKAIATLLMACDESSMDKGAQTARVSGYSVLKPASDRLMLVGTYAPKGCDGAAWTASLLSEAIAAPLEVDGSFTLDEHAVFGAGVSYLQAAWTILKAAGWCMQVAGDGTVSIKPKSSEAKFVLDESRHALMPSASRSADLSGIPNRYYAVDGDEVGIAVNDQDGSRTSVQARGRYVDYIDDSPVKVDGESMTAYARRKLEELSTVTREYGYEREFVDGLKCYDLVAGTVPEWGMDGAFRVLKQSITCGKGVVVSETVGQEIREYIA